MAQRTLPLLAPLCLVLGLMGGFALARSFPARALPEVEAVSHRTAALEPEGARATGTDLTGETPAASTSPEVTAVPESSKERIALAPETTAMSGGQMPSPPREIEAELRAEFEEYLSSGKYLERLLKDGENIQEFMAYEYSRIGEPHRAMELLDRFPTKDADVYMTVGSYLNRAEDPAAASQAYLKALELDPLEEDILDELKKIDPNRALAALDKSVEEMGGEALPMIDLQRAELLSELGRKEEAIALVQSMAGYDPEDPWAIELLAELDPEGVERSLRSRLGHDPTGAFAVNLAMRLEDQDREDEAAQLLEDTLARSPDNSNALNRLAYLEPDKALSYLDSPAADELSATALSYAAEALVERGQTTDAVELWIRAMDDRLDDSEIIDGLKQHAPERLWEKYRQVASKSTDDEELGDVADVYWENGRKEEAAELWRRASLIDPNDSEWSKKLRSVLLGQNPL